MTESIDTTIPAPGAPLRSAPVRENFAATAARVQALESAMAQRPTASQVASLAPIQSIVAGANISIANDGGVVTIHGGTTSAFVHAQITERDAADSHPLAAITGLQTALNGKAATSHTHTIANVTGLQAALDAKTTTAQAAAAAPVQAVAGKTGSVTLTKSDVGLANVDNTSDASKPVSTAQQAALNTKVTLSGENTLSTLSVAVVNVMPATPTQNVLYIVLQGG